MAHFGPMEESEYRARQRDGAIGGSSLWTIASQSLAHYVARQGFTGNDATRLGTLAHAAILEPDALHGRYAVAAEVSKIEVAYTKHPDGWYANGDQPAGPFATKKLAQDRCGPWRTSIDDTPHRTRDDATAAAQPDDGRLVAAPADYQRALSMVDAIDNNATARGLLTGGQAEVSMLWTDERSNVACSGQADYWLPDARVLVDLKTHARPTPPDAAGKWITTSGYHVQLAHYAAGIEAATGDPPDEIYIVAVESVAPYAVGVYRLSDSMLELGRYHRDRALVAYRHALAADCWPGYPDRVVDVEPPRWAVPDGLLRWRADNESDAAADAADLARVESLRAALAATQAAVGADYARSSKAYLAEDYTAACESLRLAHDGIAEVERLRGELT